VSPGIGFGEYGEGYVRVALVENEHRIRQAARNVKEVPHSGKAIWRPPIFPIRRIWPRQNDFLQMNMGFKMNTGPFKIAIAGLGTVGGGVVKAAGRAGGGELSRRAGRKLENHRRIRARDRNKARRL